MEPELKQYGHPVLRKQAREVVLPDERLKDLIEEMYAMMYREKGVGLAAPQIGLDMQLAVIDIGRKHGGKLVLINPNVISKSGECISEEGCLSMPGISGDVKRSKEIVIETSDIEGNRRTITCTGYLARAVEHELDHLNGILVIDRISTVERALLSAKLKKLRKETSKQT